MNIKKTKYQQVSEILEKQGYISDTQAVKIWGDESAIYKTSEHIRKWKKLQSDRNFFEGKKIIEKEKSYRCHRVKVEGMAHNCFYKVGKEFYNEITICD